MFRKWLFPLWEWIMAAFPADTASTSPTDDISQILEGSTLVLFWLTCDVFLEHWIHCRSAGFQRLLQIVLLIDARTEEA